VANHLLAIGLNYSGSQHALRGCINDANDWVNYFRPSLASAPVLLTEQKATKAVIVSELGKILGQLQPGDTGIVTYSGHGTYIPDTSGDETDRRDEALCPWDMDRNLLLDDELQEILRNRADGSRVLLITDCCHSGTMTRNVDQERGAARYVPFAELTCCMCSESVDRITRRARAKRFRSTDTGLTHWSGCQDDQVSYDATIAGKACGAFTYYALAALKARKTPGMNSEEMKAAVRPYLPSNRYPQSPQFSGDLAAIIPGFEPAAPPSAAETFTATTSKGRTIRGVIE